MSNQIPQEIGEYLSYDAPSGALTYIKSTNNRTKVGDVLDCINSAGYITVSFKYSRYLAHRIAWFLHTGEQPPEVIDHVDGDKLNNTFSNLREATKSQNSCNQARRRNNTSGYKGAYWNKGAGKWQSQIKYNGVDKYLGLFNTPEEAHQAYCKAADEFHKEYANYGGEHVIKAA